MTLQTMSSSSHDKLLAGLQQKVWNGCIPLEVRLAPSDCRTFDQSDPYLVISQGYIAISPER
jgi:hypothetical protein